MKSLAGRPVLEADGEANGWEDALACAMAEGGWNAFELATCEGLALAAAGRTPDAARVAEAERAWRRERRLLAASELRAWLAGSCEQEQQAEQWIHCALPLFEPGTGQLGPRHGLCPTFTVRE